MCNRIGGCSDVETSTTNWILKQSVRDRARTVPRRRRNGDDPRLRFTRGDRPWLRAAKFCVKKSSIFRIILSASFNYAPKFPFRKENAWKISLSPLSFRALEGKNLICWLFFFQWSIWGRWHRISGRRRSSRRWDGSCSAAFSARHHRPRNHHRERIRVICRSNSAD